MVTLVKFLNSNLVLGSQVIVPPCMGPVGVFPFARCNLSDFRGIYDRRFQGPDLDRPPMDPSWGYCSAWLPHNGGCRVIGLKVLGCSRGLGRYIRTLERI